MHLPSAIFVVDGKHEKIAIAEAKCLGIPTFGIVDTNTDPDCLDYPIPANDDSIKTIKLIISYIASSISNFSNVEKTETKVEVKESSISETEVAQEESLKK